MIGNRLEQSIITVFQNDLSKTFSINEISKQLKKSYPIINQKSNFFLKEGVLKKIDIGRSYQCYLNFENDKTKILLAINEVNARESFMDRHKEFQQVMDELARICTKFNNEGQISSIILSNNELIFLVKELTILPMHVKESLMIPGKFRLLFYSEELFKENFLSNTRLQHDHIILFGVDSYLDMISSINDKLLVSGMLKKNV